MKTFDKGLFLTLVLSLIVLEVFYGKLLAHCNTIYFGDNGDALQSYYTALFHVNYDKSFFHNSGMNYPYGESVFFTGGHIPVISMVKTINSVVNISGYTIGIVNLCMLLSFVVSALFIYLVLKEFLLPAAYSSLIAVCVAFMSPQIQHLGGTLAYSFFIPMFLYLLLKFNQKPSLKKSIGIGLLALFAMSTHLYFSVFFGLISFFYFAVMLLSRDKPYFTFSFAVKHFFLQLILPYLVLNAIMYFTNGATDRTVSPWGFFVYISSWASVLFPFGKTYQNFAQLFYHPSGYPEWEGIAYIGAFAVCMFFILLLVFLWKTFTLKFSKLVCITDNKMLNIFFWAGFAGLLYSFGYPFIWNKSFFIHHIGPLREIRALGRFNWLFFYVMNMVAFYSLYHWVKNKNKFVKYALMLVSLLLLFNDAHMYINHHQDTLDTSIDELTDKQNNLPVNKWLTALDLKQFQAIIPLPYFHVGSENVWISSNSDLLKYVYIVSLKTGLPTTAVMLSRTSLSQTYKNISLVLEPYRALEILKDLPNTKPFLVMAQPDKMNDSEKLLLSKCNFLFQTPAYSVYKLNYSVFAHYTDSLYANTKTLFHKTKTYPIGGFYSTDSVKNFIHFDYDEKTNPVTYQGKGSLECNATDYTVLYDGRVPNYKDSNYVFSFWMDNFTTDLYPRCVLEIEIKDSTDHTYTIVYHSPQDMLKTLDGKWGLAELDIKIRHASDKLKLTIWSEDLEKDKKLILDEFWLKPSSTNIYRETPEYMFENNRYYLR